MAKENVHFVTPRHKLDCQVIPSYESNRNGKLMRIIVNRNIARMDQFFIRDFDEKGRLDPHWFLSIVNNLGDMKQHHVPTIVDSLDQMTRKMHALNLGEESNHVGCRMMVMDYSVQNAAMCYLVANRMLHMAKDHHIENLNPLFTSQLEYQRKQKDWESILEQPPHKSLKNESGDRRFHNNLELEKVLQYLDEVLLPLIQNKVNNLADTWKDVQQRNMVMCEWEIPVWVDEELSLGLGLRNCNIRETIYTRDMTKLLFVEVATLCFIAGNTLYMLSRKAKQGNLAL